jgi:hypothetical protein
MAHRIPTNAKKRKTSESKSKSKRHRENTYSTTTLAVRIIRRSKAAEMRRLLVLALRAELAERAVGAVLRLRRRGRWGVEIRRGRRAVRLAEVARVRRALQRLLLHRRLRLRGVDVRREPVLSV